MSNIVDFMNPMDQELYATHIRRLNYDDRDYVMYENMLSFLWDFVIGKKSISEPELLYEEYTKWNKQMISKVLYHDHSRAEANIRHCYQSIVELIRKNPSDGRKELEEIGAESFSYDGKAPKIRMDAHGRVFRPMSKLFVLYNYAKYYLYHDMVEEYEKLKTDYPYAFTSFGDEEHRSHDQFLLEQMEVLSDKIIYPVEEKVYKIPWGPKDFYLYFDENSHFNL